MDPDMFEVVVFEDSDRYDGKECVTREVVIEYFIDRYKQYLSPEYYSEDDVWFNRGRLWLSYRDKSGGDKPKTVMLIGPVSNNIVAKIKEEVKKLYIVKCEDCGVVIPKDPENKWVLCTDCANK